MAWFCQASAARAVRFSKLESNRSAGSICARISTVKYISLIIGGLPAKTLRYAAS
ncbi:hypothetical protein LMG26684_05858 [Achromobacter mucicolens]|nr:hypothetical protein LMG26684_05858 [Achromobacter mucicolens]